MSSSRSPFLNVEHAEELTQLARKAGRVLMVGHLLQYHPAIQKLKSLIQEGALGKVQYIYSSRLNFGKLRTEENILWSFAPHDISAILFLLGEEPSSVAAHGGNYLNANVADVTLTSCNFASGVTAHIFVSWLHPFKEQKLVVVGDRQMAVFDDMQTERKLVLYPHRIEWLDRHPIAKRSEGQVIPLPPLEPLRLECLHFLECISTRQTPNTDGDNGVRVLRILNASELSPEKPRGGSSYSRKRLPAISSTRPPGSISQPRSAPALTSGTIRTSCRIA